MSTYEHEWPRSINNFSKTKYNNEGGMLKFPLNLLQEKYSFEIFQLKDIQLLKMDEILMMLKYISIMIWYKTQD